jgi:hypothetical protein
LVIISVVVAWTSAAESPRIKRSSAQGGEMGHWLCNRVCTPAAVGKFKASKLQYLSDSLHPNSSMSSLWYVKGNSPDR